MIRIAVQLLDTHTGRQLWADRHDVTAGTFQVQDQIAEQIASALKIGVDRFRLRVAQRAPLSSLDTYDCWLRGFECLKRGTVEADAEARSYFERALEADPSYRHAYTGLSLSHFNEWSCQAWQKWDETEPVRCRNLVTPPGRTREPHHRDDRDAGHEPRPTPSTGATGGRVGRGGVRASAR